MPKRNPHLVVCDSCHGGWRPTEMVAIHFGWMDRTDVLCERCWNTLVLSAWRQLEDVPKRAAAAIEP